MKLSEVKVGDILVADDGFTCLSANEHCEVKEADGLYIYCKQGRHYLDGQTCPHGYLIGLTKYTGEQCNGSTIGFGPFSRGSRPFSPSKDILCFVVYSDTDFIILVII